MSGALTTSPRRCGARSGARDADVMVEAVEGLAQRFPVLKARSAQPESRGQVRAVPAVCHAHPLSRWRRAGAAARQGSPTRYRLVDAMAVGIAPVGHLAALAGAD
jgi:hypothetical protein